MAGRPSEERIVEFVSKHECVSAAAMLEISVDGVDRNLALAEIHDWVSEPGLRAYLRQEFGANGPDGVLVFDSIPLEGDELDSKAVIEEARLRGDSLVHVPPSTDLEKRLAAIWSDTLALATISACDDFLDLGGDSMAAIQIMVSVEEVFGVVLDVHDLLDAGTIRRMAALLTARLETPPS